MNARKSFPGEGLERSSSRTGGPRNRGSWQHGGCERIDFSTVGGIFGLASSLVASSDLKVGQ